MGRLTNVLKDVKEKDNLLAGVSAPMNYFDPLGFSTTVDAGKLLFYREVELKHGRIAMLAALGMVVGEQYHPLFGGDIDVPSYIAFQATLSKIPMKEDSLADCGKSRRTMCRETWALILLASSPRIPRSSRPCRPRNSIMAASP